MTHRIPCSVIPLMTKTTKAVLDRVVEKVLAEAIEYAPRNQSRIAARMTELIGADKPVLRQSVARWVNPDPARREHPTLGYALFLTAAVKSLKEESK